jgi:hypothetical protein
VCGGEGWDWGARVSFQRAMSVLDNDELFDRHPEKKIHTLSEFNTWRWILS